MESMIHLKAGSAKTLDICWPALPNIQPTKSQADNTDSKWMVYESSTSWNSSSLAQGL